MPPRQIVAMGGGGFAMEPDNPLLDAFVLSRARRAAPRVCFVATASGDSPSYVERFHAAFARHDCVASDLALFSRSVRDLEAFVLDQDVVYVGGGNTANLLAVWRVHGLDAILRRAWEDGVVLAGLSAGMNCWFQQSLTDSFGADELRALDDGLGLLPGSCCPHYDGEPLRRPTYRRLVATGELADGWAADDGAALVFVDDDAPSVVTSRPAARAYRVGRVDGAAVETPLPVRHLGDEVGA